MSVVQILDAPPARKPGRPRSATRPAEAARREQAVRAYHAGVPIKLIACCYRVDRRTVLRWVKESGE
jgi:transposase-like protein